MNSKEVLVSMSLGNETISVGKLWLHTRNGRESASFEYNKSWLEHPERFALEPALKLTIGSFHTRHDLSLFGAIGDSAPDRWGRVLMRRAESAKAKVQHTVPKTLYEIDYLLGVNDEARQGALRFSVAPLETVYLAEKHKTAIPPLINLPKLLSATDRFLEAEESASDLKLLLAPGSSLGGARPKASIRDQDGTLAIAKFPKRDDEYNVVLWEAVALTLAKMAKITVPRWRLEKILGKWVLIVQRFDRVKEQRIPFLSAMSMLDARDNEQHSYIEIAYALIQNGGMPDQDMEELWRRMIFTIMISNTDNHLRNYGFVYERYKGWRLCPAYDMNPTPIEISSRIFSTSIKMDDVSMSLDTAIDVCQDFRLSKDKARKIIEEVIMAVKQWKKIALQLDLSTKECHNMSSAFEVQKIIKF